MELIVIIDSTQSKTTWDDLFTTLDEGVEEGIITYDVVDHCEVSDDFLGVYDGAIYLNVDIITEDIPFLAFGPNDYSEDDFFEFIDLVKEYIEYRDGQEFADIEMSQDSKEKVAKLVDSVENSNVCRNTGKTITIPAPNITYEITDDEVKKLIFKAVTVVIDGKEVSLSINDFIALGKMCKIMDRFGYKVRNVIL